MGRTSKVVVCGMKGVGKTTILEQSIYGNVTPENVSIQYHKLIRINTLLISGFLSNNRRRLHCKYRI